MCYLIKQIYFHLDKPKSSISVSIVYIVSSEFLYWNFIFLNFGQIFSICIQLSLLFFPTFLSFLISTIFYLFTISSPTVHGDLSTLQYWYSISECGSVIKSLMKTCTATTNASTTIQLNFPPISLHVCWDLAVKWKHWRNPIQQYIELL